MKISKKIKKLLVIAVIGLLGHVPAAQASLAINVDINHGATYSGTALAPDSGTVWNGLSITDSPVSLTITDISDSQGNTLSGIDVTMESHDGTSQINRYAAGGPTVPNPTDLMIDYSFSGTYDVTVSGLSAGTYDFWYFGHGDQNNQAGEVTVDAANGGGGGTTADSPQGRDLVNGGNGISYVFVGGVTVDGSGIFAFQVDNYINGFQLAEATTAPIVNGLADQSVAAGTAVFLNPSVLGASPITYQWKENGAPMSGETNSALSLLNVQPGQDGHVYALVASNAYGADTNSMTLTVATVSAGAQLTLNVDLNKSSGDNYTGTAVAPDSGTIWNSFTSLGSLGSGSVQDSDGDIATGVAIEFSSSDGSLSVWNDSGSGNPNPQKLMSDYTYNRAYTFDVSGLNAGQMFALYAYLHGNVDNQTGGITIGSGNGGGSGSVSQTGDYDNFRNIDIWGEDYNWVRLLGTVDGFGNVSFGVDTYINGFQLQLLAAPMSDGLIDQTVVAGTDIVLSPATSGTEPLSYQWLSNSIPLAGETGASLVLNDVQYAQHGTVYSLQASNDAGTATQSMTLSVIVTPAIDDLNNQAVAPGSTVTIAPTVSGVPSPDLQWLYNGLLLSDGITESGAILSGSTSDTLSITGAQVADSGTYVLVAGNSAGMVTNRMTLTVSASDVVPEISGPIDQTAVQGLDATFSVSVSGLPLPALQWQLNGIDIPGSTNESITVNNVQYVQDGDVYTLVASNVAGIESGSAVLHVRVPPTVSSQPADVAVESGSSAMFSVVANGVPAVSYQWSRDGSPITGATNATYSIASVQGSDNGAVFSVVVSNSVDSIVSSDATLSVLSGMTGSFLPADGSTGIAPDQQLRIVFSGGTPELVCTGKKLYVYDAADDSLFATIDTDEFQTFSTDSATVQNAFIRSTQGKNFFYMPIAVYGNEAWITLNIDERFEYDKTYYITFDTGLFIDASGASFPGITDSASWRFSTKSSGPAMPTASTGPTEVTVGLDGSGDFATLQGASDWIPQNNSLERTITILPGTYRDFAVFYQGRDYVNVIGAGASREDVQIIYPNAAFTSGSSCGMIRVEDSDDLYFRNLTLDNEVYLSNPLNNYGPFPGRLNVLVTKYAERLVFDNVLIKGGQDTLYADSGSAYFTGCEIWGSVDFIYGVALAVFDTCEIVQIRESGSPIGAPKTDLAAPYGEVFLNCRFPRALVANGYPYDVGMSNTTFQRPWGKDGMTAIINCQLDVHISTKAWGEWGGRETTCRIREYGSTMIGGGPAPTPAQRQAAGAYWLNTIDPDYVSNTNIDPMDPLLYGTAGRANRVQIVVDPADYTLDAIFGHPYYGLGDWRPGSVLADPPEILSQPVSQAVAPGSSVSLSVDASTSTGATNYLWLVDSGIITAGNVSGTSSAMLTITGFQSANEGSYHVAVSDGSSITTSSQALLTLATAPTIINDGIEGAELTLLVPTQYGPTYLVQTNTDLSSENWQDAQVIAGDGTIHSVVTEVADADRLFVRIKVQ